MEKKYMKPEMDVMEMEPENICVNQSPVTIDYDPEADFDAEGLA